MLLNRTTDNAEINLDCNNSTTGNSLQAVTWFWNGNVLDEALSDNGTRALNRSASNPMDLFGIYQCFASNPAGSVATLVRVLPLGEYVSSMHASKYTWAERQLILWQSWVENLTLFLCIFRSHHGVQNAVCLNFR